MIYKTNFSLLGLGFMRHDSANFKRTQELVDYAIQNGINYFEACSFYLNNKCESIVGRALSKYPRYKYYLCDKYDIIGYHLPIDQLEVFFNNQLKACNVDYFDVYLIQALDRRSIQNLQNGVYDFFKQKKNEGKIKHLGFSFHDTAPVLELYLKTFDWDCCQIQLNYYDWYLGEGKKLYSIIEKYNIPTFVMGPFKGGTLTVKQPEEIKNKYTLSYLSHLAMHFLQTLPNITVILSGAEYLSMLKNNIYLINNYSFTQKDKENCLSILEIYKKNNVINCTECHYCEQKCPNNIPIAEFFRLYNKILLEPDNKKEKEKFVELTKGENSFFNCCTCHNCENKCPQHLPILQYFNNQLFTARL